MQDHEKNHVTPLYHPKDRNHPNKINSLITQNFLGQPLNLSGLEDLTGFVSTVRLVDLLDFSRLGFDKQIALNITKAAEIQSQWPIFKLSDLVEIISGGTPDTGNNDYWNGDIPWLSVADFSKVNRFVESADKTITEQGLKNSSTKILQMGDIIVSARGTVGAMAQLKKPMAFNQSCYGLRAKDKSSNDYIFYVFSREIEQLKARAFGSKFDAITIKTFDEVKIPLPPLEIQQKIVTECEVIDNAVAAAQAAITTAQKNIDVQIADIFNKNYPFKTISQIGDVKGGKRIPKGFGYANEITNYPYIRVSDFFDKTISIEKMLYISEQTFSEIQRYTISKHDIYISIAGTIGLCGTVPDELDGKSLTENAAKIVIKNRNELDHKYLALVLNDKSVQEQIRERTKGIGVPKLSLYEVEKLSVPIPPLTDQQTLVAEIEKLEQTIAAAQTLITEAAAKKQAVLDKYL